MFKNNGFIALFMLFCLVSAMPSQAQQNEQLLEAGPMLGHVELEEANLWLQTTRPSRFEIKYWKKNNQNPIRHSYRGTTDKRESNTSQIKLANLDEGTTYRYEVYVDSTKINFSYPTEFTTLQYWQWRKPPPDFTLALGSCLYINDPDDDRPGEPYGGDPAIMETIAGMNPDLMLWMGDNIYYREPDFYSEEQMDERYRDARNTPEMQRLLATAVNLATWDDHDYGPNNADRTYRMREEALDIFKRYWSNPGYGIKGTAGVFTRYKYADAEFFLTDDRYHRAPNRLKDPEKPFLGEEQLQWLLEGLVSSEATFKFVVVGNQVTNTMNEHEAMIQYKKEYRKLINFLDKHNVEGVVFLSGDRHITELLKTERNQKYPLYEFTSSPLTAGNYTGLDQTEEFNNPQRVDGTLVYRRRNFGFIKVTGEEGHRKAILQTFNKEGKKLWEHTISEQDLR